MSCASLPYMSIGSRVVLAVTFEQVNAAPYAKTAAKRDDQSLKNLDCTVEKIHKILCRERSAVFRRPLCFIPGAPFKNNIN